MIRLATTLILLSEPRPSGYAVGIGIWMWFNIFLFFFTALIGLGISYLTLRLKRKWKTTVAVWSLIMFFPIYFGVSYELVTRTSFLFFEYGFMISSGLFGAELIGIQMAIVIVAWFIGYDWLRGKRPKLPESTGGASFANEKTETSHARATR
jgi:hypothetical protein